MAGMLSGCGSERHSQVSRAAFRSTVDGKATDLYTLRNARGLEMTVTNFGGRVVELWVPDRDGNFADIVLGHDNLGAYVDQTGERFLGATIGRYGNRIAAGRFTLDGKEYTLPLNDGPNSLHGGAKGFDMVVWDVVEVTPQKIVLACLSPDGDQGYPGNLKVTMTYELTDDNSFVITHEAATDRRTVVNLTHHSFFNLHGAGGPPINDHELIAADFFTPVDSTLIPTGRLMPVEGTPMDFRRPAPIGSRLDADFEQLRHGHGYDHNWVLSRRSTHDLELALKTADRIVVFYAGTAVEEAACVDFDQEAALRHPYTRALFRAMPEHGFAPEPGIQPYVRDLPEGCPYGPRCPKYREECSKDIPYVPYQGGLVRCICPGDEKEILPGILSESEVLKEKMTSEPSSGECSVCGKEGAGL